MTKNTEEAAADLTAELGALRRDMASLTETMRELMEQQTQASGFRVSGAFAGARNKIASTATDAQNRVRNEIEAAIERNPLIAALIAFLVGIWLGMAGRSRS